MEIITNLKINPNFKQMNTLWNLSNECRMVYNHFLSEKLNLFNDKKLHNSDMSYKKDKKDLHLLREKENHYNIVNVKVLQKTIKTLNNDFNIFLHNFYLNKKVNPPKFKGKKYFMNMIFDRFNNSFLIQNGKLILIHSLNNVKLEFILPKNIEIKNIKEIELLNTKPYKGKGDFILKIKHSINKIKYFDNKQYQAFDLGIWKFVTAINSKGKTIQVWNPRINDYWYTKINQIRYRMKRCKKFSRRWYRLKTTLIKVSLKKKNAMKNYLHKLSKKLITNTKANTLIIGDLSVNQIPEMKKGFNKLDINTQNNIYLHNFINLLSYKAENIGKKVIKIDEYNTSKMCCVCGKLHKMKINKRIMKCECGNEIDRDINSAINIMKRYLSQNALWMGYQFFIDNLQEIHSIRIKKSCKNSYDTKFTISELPHKKSYENPKFTNLQ